MSNFRLFLIASLFAFGTFAASSGAHKQLQCLSGPGVSHFACTPSLGDPICATFKNGTTSLIKTLAMLAVIKLILTTTPKESVQMQLLHQKKNSNHNNNCNVSQGLVSATLLVPLLLAVLSVPHSRTASPRLIRILAMLVLIKPTLTTTLKEPVQFQLQPHLTNNSSSVSRVLV